MEDLIAGASMLTARHGAHARTPESSTGPQSIVEDARHANRYFLVTAHDTVLVRRLVGDYSLTAQRDGADARGGHAGSGDRAGGEAAIDERHFGSVGRAGDRGLDEGIPARAGAFRTGDKALHILERGDGREADPDAESYDDDRKNRTPVSARGKEWPQINSSKHRPSPGRNKPTPWRAKMVH